MRVMQVTGSRIPVGAETFYVRMLAALGEKCDVLPVVRRGSWLAAQLKEDGIAFEALARSARRNTGDAVSMGSLFGALVLSLFLLTASQSFFSNRPAMLLWFLIALTMAAARGPWRGGRSDGIRK